jgi:hypothetical protein
VKNVLKGKRFQDVEGIKENVTAELNTAEHCSSGGLC